MTTDQKFPGLLKRSRTLRIFEDQVGKIHLSVRDVEGKILLVSQFTLYGNCQAGRRPSFTETMPPYEAQKLYETFIHRLKETMGEDRVATGDFGATMQVELVNDGPVTLSLER